VALETWKTNRTWHKLAQFVIVSVSAFLLGCATRTYPPGYFYDFKGEKTASATITGYELFNIIFFAGPKLWILEIDGKPIENGEEHPTESYSIASGEREIRVGAWGTGNAWGRVRFKFDAKPGKEYKIDYGTAKDRFGLPAGNMFAWIEEKGSGVKVTEDATVVWVGPYRPTYQPVIPIFIPKK
jgi:hypothetical protein